MQGARASRPPLNKNTADGRLRTQNKSAADSPSQPRFRLFIRALIGFGLLISPTEAPPSLWQGASSAASPLCPSTVIGNSVPPKEPPLLRCKAPPPKRLTTSIKELDPIHYPSAFLSSLASAMFVPTPMLTANKIVSLRFV